MSCMLINVLMKLHRCKVTHSWSKKQVKTLVENRLIGLTAEAEALQKLVCHMHHFMHSNIIFLQSSSSSSLQNISSMPIMQ